MLFPFRTVKKFMREKARKIGKGYFIRGLVTKKCVLHVFFSFVYNTIKDKT